jgi:phosphate transport system protein
VRAWAAGREGPRAAGFAVELALLAAVYGRFAATAARIGRRATGFTPVEA